MLQLYRLLPGALLVMMLSGCELVGDIFEAGFWVGVIVVVLVIVLVVWLIFQLFD